MQQQASGAVRGTPRRWWRPTRSFSGSSSSVTTDWQQSQGQKHSETDRARMENTLGWGAFVPRKQFRLTTSINYSLITGVLVACPRCLLDNTTACALFFQYTTRKKPRPTTTGWLPQPNTSKTKAVASPSSLHLKHIVPRQGRHWISNLVQETP